MNEQLKFSWGHIIAFLAMISIGYITFMGVTYQSDGDFTKAGITTAIVMVVMFVFFIGAQYLKATESKFSKKIWLERVLIFVSPVVFIIAFIPYSHFWTVRAQDDIIVQQFTDAIKASNQMFDDYDSYCAGRIDNYSTMLGRVIGNKSLRPDEFSSCGFKSGKEQIQKDNMIKALRLQLISENYDSLKTSAKEWIETSSHGASTWNVFLLGNTKEIKSAIQDWQIALCGMSENVLSNEEFAGNKVEKFSDVSPSLENVVKGLDRLKSKYTTTAAPNILAIITAVVLYFMMLFPWLLQERHTKNPFGLITNNTWTESSSEKKIKSNSKKAKKKDITSDEDIDLTYTSNVTEEIDDDYGSFTM